MNVVTKQSYCFVFEIAFMPRQTSCFARKCCWLFLPYRKLLAVPAVIRAGIAGAIGKSECARICDAIIFILRIYNIAVRVFIAVEKQRVACAVIPINAECLGAFAPLNSAVSFANGIPAFNIISFLRVSILRSKNQNKKENRGE